MFELNIKYSVNGIFPFVCSHLWSVHKLYVATVIHVFTRKYMYRVAGTFVHNCISVQFVDLFACLMPVVAFPDNKMGNVCVAELGVLLGALPQ